MCSYLQPWIARIPVNAFALLDLQGVDRSIGSLVWGGTVTNSGPNAATLTAGSDNTSTTFSGVIQDGTSATGLSKLGTGTLTLSGSNTYSGATNVNVGTLAGGATNVFSPNSAFTVASGSYLDLGGFNQAIGSLAGAGTVTNSGVSSPATLTAGGDNTSTTFSGVIQDGNSATALTKTGTGTLTLSGPNTYSGVTTVSAGILDVEGSIEQSVQTNVNASATLTGTGTVGNATIASGGIFMPGNSSAGSAMAVSGNLAFQSGAFYLVQINPTTASFANITGTATLGGATVNAIYANGSYVSKQYTILTAGGGVNGSFGSVVNTNLPSGFSTSLSYDANDAYLNLKLDFSVPSGLNNNQQQVGNALTNFFNTTGSIPIVFGTLSPAGLAQLSGEVGTGSQQTTFAAMTQFMNVLLDPFVGGRGDTTVPASGPSQFADEGHPANAYASTSRKRSGAERDVYGMITKAVPRPANFDQRWSVWAAGFGGSQTTDGSAAVGSNNTTSRIYGTAVGADYRFSPFTLAGFALAGAGTNFSIANGLGSGRSDLLQAGAFFRHTVGAGYVTGALAYGWQDVTTNRTLTIAGIDQLQGKFNTNAFSGRLEGGHRFATPWMGVTPYAAGQFTRYDLPAYAEQVLSGRNNFALNYAAKNVAASRSELGVRSDKSYALTDTILTLRSRLAWAHNLSTDPSIAPTFQTLPGAPFVVNGAAQARDAALATASAEMKWRNGFSLAGTLEGEISHTTTSFAGKGIVKYVW